jgi:DNA invertase Pin-like site-specific DNA recombinase
MNKSELITAQHLSRKAMIYIRQSSPHQAVSNQESLRLQYALHQRALDLGWPAERVELIDSDLGTTAASAEHRAGFKELLAQVTLGQVGIILSFDVTRLSRNCSDWYPLLDLCGYRGCLIADRDGVYDPGSANGRLLLGLKGQISELELHTIRARLTAGILNKAQRGELVSLAINNVRNSASMFIEPLTHFVVGPGPFDGLGIATIVLRCRDQDMFDKRFSAGPGLALEIIVTESIDQDLGLIEPRGMHGSIA